jgi:hypothetical protein
MTTLRRLIQQLERLEADLSPKQVVMRYLVEMAAHATEADFLRWVVSDELSRQLDAAHARLIARVTRKAPSSAKARAIQTLETQFNTWWQWATLPALVLELQRYEWLYRGQRLALMLSRLWRNRPDTATQAQWAALRRQLLEHYGDVSGFQSVVQKIEARYFDRLTVLRSEQVRLLQSLEQQALRQIDAYNQAMEWVVEAPQPAQIPAEPLLRADDLISAQQTAQADWQACLTQQVRYHVLSGQGAGLQATEQERQWLKTRLGSSLP